jgi:hypothetical protein
MTILFSKMLQIFIFFFYTYTRLFHVKTTNRINIKWQKTYLFLSIYNRNIDLSIQHYLISMERLILPDHWRNVYRIYFDKCHLFWPRPCPPNFFCLFYAHETIALALVELCLLPIFNQDHRICVHVRKDDKSIISLLCSVSETGTVITITL